jgi:hypothetical protein
MVELWHVMHPDVDFGANSESGPRPESHPAANSSANNDQVKQVFIAMLRYSEQPSYNKQEILLRRHRKHPKGARNLAVNTRLFRRNAPRNDNNVCVWCFF